MMHFRSGPIFAILFVIVTCAGCLFEPRDPEPPGTSQTNYLPATDTDNVLENLQRAIGALDPNGYERMLASDFTYEPDGGTLANYPDVDWEAWDSAQEIAFMAGFLSNVIGVIADLKAETFGDTPGPTEAELRYVYALTVTEIGNSELKYRAQATLEFRIDGTEWRLSRWIDEQGETDPESNALLPSLGQRRGAFAASGGN
jgi:hypothetical protein